LSILFLLGSDPVVESLLSTTGIRRRYTRFDDAPAVAGLRRKNCFLSKMSISAYSMGIFLDRHPTGDSI